MKNQARLFCFVITGVLGYSCSKDDSDKASVPPDPVAPAVPSGPTPPVIPSSPVVTNPPEQPGPPPIPADDTANSGEIKLAALPPSGVPTGYQSWDEFNMKDPTSRSLLIFDGSDPVQELLGDDPLCSLYVLAGYLNEKAEPTYVLRTSFKHNDQSHGWLKISLAQNKTPVTGRGGNDQDEISLQLAQAGDLLSVTRLNLKWFHINHFDTGVCTNLKLRPRS